MDMDNASMVQGLRVSFHLLKQITNHFSEDRILRGDGYGTVYMGELIDGRKVAVKVLGEKLGADYRMFEEDCLNLACLQHKNIVRLVGYCHKTTKIFVPYNGRMVLAEMTKRALCFEYVHNESLDRYLSDESSGLDWPTRYAIIKGICEGLKYLHEELKDPMYHLDLNPSNILLDENMLPKMKDFGSSRLAGYEQIPGYMPPEYIRRGVVSAKFDIFSLGVTIIKIMTGREGYFTIDEMTSREFIESVYGSWMNRLLQETSGDELESYCKQVKTCAEIGMSCLEDDRHKRPTIGIIVTKLNETETMRPSLDALRNAPPRRTAASASASAPSGSTASSGVAIGSPAHPRGALMSKDPTVMVPLPPLADSAQPLPPAQQMTSEPHYMSFQHLNKITGNFSENKIIGHGGSCVVYKGEHDGESIAVKKITQNWCSEEISKKTKKQFKNEVKLLMKIKHPNIVELLGHCYETHSARISDKGRDILLWQIDCLLCLEFLPESLNNHISDATSGLDWHTRYKIIEGISDGLQYLHEQSIVPIIHLDLKPGNILLDGNMVPKIADFGISRPFDQGKTIHTNNTIGTPGYIPPESIQVGTLSLMSDIFSLGVIIIEVITGQRDYPLDLEASSKEFIDTELSKWRNRLQKEPGNTNLETDCQQIEKCIQIGLMCLNRERTKRPTIRKITNILKGLESTTRENGPLPGRGILGREDGCRRYLHHVLVIGICATTAFSVKYEWWKWI